MTIVNTTSRPNKNVLIYLFIFQDTIAVAVFQPTLYLCTFSMVRFHLFNDTAICFALFLIDLPFLLLVGGRVCLEYLPSCILRYDEPLRSSSLKSAWYSIFCVNYFRYL